MVHLDGTGGTNKNGFWLATLLVVDEYGNGVPVDSLITSSEGAQVHEDFLVKMREAVRAKAPGGSDYDYNFVMIDKSPTETAAIRGACGCPKHVYCFFHFLQVRSMRMHFALMLLFCLDKMLDVAALCMCSSKCHAAVHH
jgi:hypothetical protein